LNKKLAPVNGVDKFIKRYANIVLARLQNRLQKIAFWVWVHFSGGKEPFYNSPSLDKFKTFTPPDEADWFGVKLWAWNKAVAYLVSIGKLTYTPTLAGKF